MRVGKDKTITIVHYACKSENAPGTFVSTGKRSTPENPVDRTIVYKCDECDITIGVERGNKYIPREITIYI